MSYKIPENRANINTRITAIYTIITENHPSKHHLINSLLNLQHDTKKIINDQNNENKFSNGI